MCTSGEGNCTDQIFCREKVLVSDHVEKIFFPMSRKKYKKEYVCVCVSAKAYPLVALVILQWLILRCTRNLQPFLEECLSQLFGPFFLQCLGFILIALCRCIWDPNACVCKWQTAALARMGIYACSATQTGFRSLWKSAPLQDIVGGFGWVFCSDTTEQQPFFIMIEKLISTLWWWWVWRAMIGVCFLPHAVITKFCLWKHKTKTYWDFGVVMKPELCGALE